MGWPCSQDSSIQPHAALSPRRHYLESTTPPDVAASHNKRFAWYLQSPMLPSHLPRALEAPVQFHVCRVQHRQLCYTVTANPPGKHSLEMGKGPTCRKGRLPPTEGLLKLWAEPSGWNTALCWGRRWHIRAAIWTF